MPFVLDSSVALAWVLPDERGADVDRIADSLESDTAVVPGVWPLEILNALLTAVRRARISGDDLGRLLQALAALPVEVERTELDAKLDAISGIAQLHALTSYDAAYVELAKRRGIALATLDRKLREVCLSEGISVIP